MTTIGWENDISTIIMNFLHKKGQDLTYKSNDIYRFRYDEIDIGYFEIHNIKVKIV